MQQVFAYKTCVAANAELTNEKIIEYFTPDLNSLEPQDPKQLEGYAKLAMVHFDKFLKTGDAEISPELPETVQKQIKEALHFYKISNSNDLLRISRKMVEDCERLYEDYLLTLLLFTEIADKIAEVKKINRLVASKIYTAIKNHELLNKELSRRSISLANDEDLVGELIMALMESEEFKSYRSKPVSIEADKEMAIFILRNIFFKSPKYHDYFENLNLNWQEDKVAIKDMVGDTIKSIQEGPDFVLAGISKNWDDDKDFMKTLFSKTIEQEQTIESYIVPKLKNWDISRLTATDGIILKLCLCEMINFYNIPVKVSLNEYIEVAKRYSTPKSKTLINGVLDNLAIELQQNGIIKKSGRGLMDNK